MLVPLICILLRPCSGWQVESLARCFSALFYFTGDHFIPSLCYPPPNQQLRQMHSARKADLCHPPKNIQSSFVTVNSFTCVVSLKQPISSKEKDGIHHVVASAVLCASISEAKWEGCPGAVCVTLSFAGNSSASACLSSPTEKLHLPTCQTHRCDAAIIETFQVCKVFRQMES